MPEGAGVGLGSLVREMGHNSQALLAFFAVSNVDLIVARHTLSPHDAGLYAAGLILTKAVLFLPQFVSVVAFPSMAADDSSRTFNLAVLSVAGLGALATLATALLPGLALIFVGGGGVRRRPVPALDLRRARHGAGLPDDGRLRPDRAWRLARRVPHLGRPGRDRGSG